MDRTRPADGKTRASDPTGNPRSRSDTGRQPTKRYAEHLGVAPQLRRVHRGTALLVRGAGFRVNGEVDRAGFRCAVHGGVGAANPSACGALMMGAEPAEEITAAWISFGWTRHYRNTQQHGSVLVWRFGL